MKNRLLNSRKGATLTNWIFVIALMLLMLVILQTEVLSPMNKIYNKSFQTGLDTSGLEKLQGLKSTSESEIQGAEVSQTSEGLTLKSAWTVGKGTYNTIVDFISGNFIYTLLVNILNFSPVIATTLIVMIWISLIMIIIYLFMKVVP